MREECVREEECPNNRSREREQRMRMKMRRAKGQDRKGRAIYMEAAALLLVHVTRFLG